MPTIESVLVANFATRLARISTEHTVFIKKEKVPWASPERGCCVEHRLAAAFNFCNSYGMDIPLAVLHVSSELGIEPSSSMLKVILF